MRFCLELVAKQFGLVVLLACLSSAVPAADQPVLKQAPRGFVQRVYQAEDGSKHPFLVFVPYHYDRKQPAPALLFLHGAGERGDNNIDQVIVGLAPAIMKNRGKFPFVTVFPQCAREHNWLADGPDAKLALAMLKQTQDEFATDSDRVYLTGLSMGGQGTWTLAAQNPEMFAAIVPMCSHPDSTTAAKLAAARLPSWNFCGDKDAASTVQANRDMAEALKKAGAPHKYTEYAGVGHNCWDAAYGTPELYTWLLQHSRSANKKH